jgi:glyoxylase-like metal-dependent hydrolase (beta-lactamase superfamily II)
MDKVESRRRTHSPRRNRRRCARSAHRLRQRLRISHSNGEWTLIDAGLPLSAHRIDSWARQFFNSPPNAIVLTHGHFDHASEARELADKWNIPI